MNLPNKLTVARIVLAPLFLAALMLRFPFHYLVAGLIFGAASLTDLFDGKIARKRGLITDLGKFLDPLADKMLTTAAFLGFMAAKELAFARGWMTWAVMLILTREFLVTSVRLVAAAGGKVIAASWFGKAKTVAQMIAILYLCAALEVSTWGFLPAAFTAAFAGIALPVGVVFVWVATVLTVLSGAEYFWKNREFFLAGTK